MYASAFGAYFLFGGLALFTAGIVAAYMLEMRGRSLEDIRQAFQRSALSATCDRSSPESGYAIGSSRMLGASGRLLSMEGSI
ncbi:hypothetical protein SLS62_008409 [Diatrype stigma]|uniref:Uncharacterized protein n=1 Tax=Diatrype stigma TaxID=117547 RepID=A0AAN9UKH4_9PEZI